ncbi:MAG: hypothetical protein SXV54_25360, partial [Chloroflexota bacterium]|nr:hypothetical protein [Chloroflexota bacterium]
HNSELFDFCRVPCYTHPTRHNVTKLGHEKLGLEKGGERVKTTLIAVCYFHVQIELSEGGES